jgi:hypothetical protein
MIELVGGLVEAWTAIYTIGLPSDMKEGRRAEIRSDLWDQCSLAAFQDDPVLETAGHVFVRLVLGIPGDIAWRAETGVATRRERRSQMTESWKSRIGLLIAIVLALFPIVLGLSIIVGNGEWDSAISRVMWGGLWIITGVAIVAGLLTVRRAYGPGMALIAIGLVAFWVSTFWMAFITVPAGIGVLILAHFRGRRVDTSQSAGTA